MQDPIFITKERKKGLLFHEISVFVKSLKNLITSLNKDGDDTCASIAGITVPRISKISSSCFSRVNSQHLHEMMVHIVGGWD